MPQSAGLTIIYFSRKDLGAYGGEALVALQSGERARVAVYAGDVIYFGNPAFGGDPLLAGDALDHEVQIALRDYCPELFLPEDEQ
jgi:hypothetical protein